MSHSTSLSAARGVSWSLYGLVDPTDGRVRYCGITSKPLRVRLRQHLCPCNLKTRTHKTCWIKSLLNAGRRPDITALQSGLTQEQAAAAEMRYIAEHRGALTNAAAGGTAPMAGRVHSAATRKKMAATNRGKGNPFYGRAHGEETRKKISAALTGRVSWNKGKPWGAGTRKKIAAARARQVAPNKGATRFDLAHIRRLRAGGMSQYEIARAVGANQSSISRILRTGKSSHC